MAKGNSSRAVSVNVNLDMVEFLLFAKVALLTQQYNSNGTKTEETPHRRHHKERRGTNGLYIKAIELRNTLSAN